MKRFLLGFVLLGFVATLSAQTISYTTLGSNYSQNFDALPNSGTFPFSSNGPLEILNANGFGGNVSGWYVQRYSGSSSNILWNYDDGGSITGAAYSYGTTLASDRALGSLASGARRHRYGALITNNTGSTINKFTLTFYTEQWRRGGNLGGNTNAFEYKINATGIDDASGFLAVTSLDMVTPNTGASGGANDGNLPANRTLVTYTVGALNWPDGQVLAIRWSDVDESSTDDGLALDDLVFSADVQVITNYYSKSTGNLTAVATWGTNTDGTGTSPSNFTDDAQLFNVVNRTTVTLDANWTVSGAGSKVIVGDGLSATTLVLPVGAALTGTVDVTNLGTLQIVNTSLPTFGTLSLGSTVDYAQTTSPYVVATGTTYHHLKLTGNTKTFASGTVPVNGNLTIDGVTDFNGAASPFTSLNIAGNFSLQGGSTFEADGTGDSKRITVTCTGSGTQTFSGGDFYLFRLQTPAAGTLNIILSSANLTLGNANGGGLLLLQNTHTLSLNSNTLTLHESGLFYGTNVGTLSGTTTSNLVIDKTLNTGSIGSIGFASGAQLLNNLTYNCTSGSSTTLTLSSDLTLSGNLNMTGGKIDIGANDLSVTGTATSSNYSYVMTSGAGFLKLLGVNGSRFAPIGNSTYNAVTVTNTDNLDWNLRVEDALNVYDPLFSGNTVKAVQREWYVNPVTYPTTTNSTIVFEYNDGDATQIGTSYNTSANVQVWRKQPGPPNLFNWVAYSGTQVPGGTPGSDRTAQVTGFNSFTGYSFAISNLDGPLPVKLIDFKVQKINNGLANLTWELAACCSNAAKFEIQKSGDSRSFVSFATVNGSETNRFYTYNDARLGAGITYYRLKMTDVDGSVSYSKVVAVVNQADGFVITSLSPNPATSVAKLSISSARMLPVSFVIYNTNGAIIKRWSSVIAEGNAVVDVEVARLPAGVYTIMAVSGTSKASIRLVKQ